MIYKRAKKYVAKYIILFVKENNAEFNRFGIVASKKIGKAVKRNKVRRQIRAIIMKESTNLKPNHDIVIVSRVSIKNAGYYEIYKDLLLLFKKAKLC